jgi:hypothetical protein
MEPPSDWGPADGYSLYEIPLPAQVLPVEDRPADVPLPADLRPRGAHRSRAAPGRADVPPQADASARANTQPSPDVRQPTARANTQPGPDIRQPTARANTQPGPDIRQPTARANTQPDRDVRQPSALARIAADTDLPGESLLHTEDKEARPKLAGLPDADTVVFPVQNGEPEAGPDASVERTGSTSPLPGWWPRVATRPRPAAHTGPSNRRTWVSRAVLLAILCGQAVLSVRLSNTAFEDEALYLYSGHMELAHLLHGTALQGNYASYFSGAPVLYPVLAAVMDNIGGLALARALSLAEMLTVTALLYSVTRMLFNERTGLCAATLFSVTEATLFLGHLATYDATALCLLAVASWIVVRTASWHWPAYVLAAPIAVLAAATKYAAALFLPTIAVLAALAAMPYLGRRALLRTVAFGVVAAALIAGALRLAGHNYMLAISSTTTNRAQGSNSAGLVLRYSAEWGGLVFGLAILGAIAYAWRTRTEPDEHIALTGGRLRRVTLGVLLAGTALLAPAYQMHLDTITSLQKHVGFGLFFAAPVAGVGLARLVGDHFRRAQIGVAVWGVCMTLGISQSAVLYGDWPDSASFVQHFRHYLRPHAHYLVEVDEVPIYYLLGNSDAQPDQFTSTYDITYIGSHGNVETGTAGYEAAIRAGYFRVIAYNSTVTPSLDQTLGRLLASDKTYRLAAKIHQTLSSGTTICYIWVKR